MGVTLGKKQLNKGRISLYLNYSHNGKRRKEYLGIILEAPVTPEARAENKNKILIAKQIRAKKELEFLSVEYALNKTAETFEDILPEAPSNGPDFFRIMNEYLSTYYKKDKKMVKSTILHLRTFNKKKILPINKITREFCVDFLDYLRSKLRGNTPIGYFKKFRMCINKCVEKKLISHNPTNGIRLSQFDEVTKEILTLKEIQKLAVTSCPNNEVKRAFLFSCYCGLRWCDVYQLRYKDVDFPARRLTIIQQKVQTHSKSAILHLNLNHTALKLLQKCNGDREDLVFSLPSYSYTIKKKADGTGMTDAQPGYTYTYKKADASEVKNVDAITFNDVVKNGFLKTTDYKVKANKEVVTVNALTGVSNAAADNTISVSKEFTMKLAPAFNKAKLVYYTNGVAGTVAAVNADGIIAALTGDGTANKPKNGLALQYGDEEIAVSTTAIPVSESDDHKLGGYKVTTGSAATGAVVVEFAKSAESAGGSVNLESGNTGVKIADLNAGQGGELVVTFTDYAGIKTQATIEYKK